MFKGIPYSNKIVKRREEQRLQNIHKQNLRNIRPITTNFEVPVEAFTNPFISNKKKEMLQEDRFTEIERQNRLLLEKINSIMTKNPAFKIQKTKGSNSVHSEKHKMNKSLNQGFRKKQLENIEIQNAMLLKRIMDKKSDYEAQKLKQEWKKQKQVIKNITNYPFIIRDKIYKGRRKSTTSYSSHQQNIAPLLTEIKKGFTASVKLMRIKKLEDSNFLITINYDGEKVVILGDNKSKKQIKVIEIPKQEALQFIQFECDGKIEFLFDCLRYNSANGDLYLVGKGVEIDKNQNKIAEDDKVNKKIEQQRQVSEIKDNQDKKEVTITEVNENEVEKINKINEVQEQKIQDYQQNLEEPKNDKTKQNIKELNEDEDKQKEKQRVDEQKVSEKDSVNNQSSQ